MLMPKELPKEQKTLDFEASLATLDGLVNKLEGGELSLEESLSAFEQGINLTRQCQQHLTDAEQKVSMLIGNEGALQLTDFDSPESN
ncbi:MAG: exodeoxyribonuclease VII small subunit [Pseudohongiellaceae bacterium]|jgi:exodeoxyribonuclease VII small subunit